MKIKRLFFCIFIVFAAGVCSPPQKQDTNGALPSPPLDMEELKERLSYARGETLSDEQWPRTITYRYDIYDFKTDSFSHDNRTFDIAQQPVRIIPHAVGVADILWAVCPRERILVFNEFSADSEFSFIAEEVKKRGNIFQSKQTELIIGFQPDIVFTVFYSDTTFKDKLREAKIPYFDLGYFGTMESIRSQILLIGNIIGEEGNAETLVKTIDEKIRELKSKLPQVSNPPRVLYYDEGGYIPGKSSNFSSICEMINVINVGAEKGIASWSQIDFETLIKWDPQIIIVPRGSNLKKQLTANRILSHANAVKNNKVYEVPGVYLRVDSQYMLLSANLIAGIVYGQ